MRALVLAEIPDAHVAAAVARYQLALVRVDDDVVDGGAVGVVALNGAGADIPDLDGAVLGAGDHPFGVDVEADAGDVVGVAVEGEDGVGVGLGGLVAGWVVGWRAADLWQCVSGGIS